MKRREFLELAGAALLSAPKAFRAQANPSKKLRIVVVANRYHEADGLMAAVCNQMTHNPNLSVPYNVAWPRPQTELVSGVGTVYLLVVAAVSDGRAKIADETSITCVSGNEITKGDNLFAPECDKFSDLDKNSVLGYCKSAYKKEPKGYGECGLVLVFQHRCPNNTLPIFHADHTKWAGLFPRHG